MAGEIIHFYQVAGDKGFVKKDNKRGDQVFHTLTRSQCNSRTHNTQTRKQITDIFIE